MGGTTKVGGQAAQASKSWVDIKGTKELNEFFKTFPKKLQDPKNLTKIFRENSKPLVEAAKSRVPVKSGQLRNSIGFFTTKASKKAGGGYVGPKIKGAFRSKEKTGFYGAFVEYGTFRFGKGKEQEFMKPAYEATKNIMLFNLLRDAEKMMQKEAKKLVKWGTLGYRA
tara:strand:+ start:1623 stop:2126 length:504 start_codon:yes stop_codon:yes gene_type:complete